VVHLRCSLDRCSERVVVIYVRMQNTFALAIWLLSWQKDDFILVSSDEDEIMTSSEENEDLTIITCKKEDVHLTINIGQKVSKDD